MHCTGGRRPPSRGSTDPGHHTRSAARELAQPGRLRGRRGLTMSDDLAALSRFEGTARLFPLPNLVLFPHVIQPLHIFEPRYREMMADALAGDRLVSIVLLRPGWEASYQGQPLVHEVACLGRIVADQRLEDGRFHLLLRGLARVRI